MQLVGGDRRRPDQPPLVVVLLGYDGEQAAHAHPVAPHRQERLVAGLVHDGGARHDLGVLVPELEGVGGLDRPDQLDGPAAARAVIPAAHLGVRSPFVHGEVAVEDGIGDMVIAAVGPGDPRPAGPDLQVGDDPDPVLLLAGRAHITLDQAGVGGKVVLFEQAPTTRQPRLPVPGHEQERRPALVVEDGQALQEVGGGDTAVGEDVHHVADPRPAGGVVLDHRSGPGRRRPGCARRSPGWPPRRWRRTRRRNIARTSPPRPPRAP